MLLKSFDWDEYLEISSNLEKFHGVFNKLWSWGRPTFSDQVKTAGVKFDRIGEVIDFIINPNFWAALDLTQKLFVICHECLHLILNHGIRIMNCDNIAKANVALDLVVNHSLITRFSFNREEVDPDNKYCWIDTVFKDPEDIEEDRSFEYYYNLLEDGLFQESLDLHDFQDFSDLVKKLNSDLKPEDKDGLKNLVERHYTRAPEEVSVGVSPTKDWQFIDISRVPIKRKWETVVKYWAHQKLAEELEETWTRRNPRLSLLPGEHLLPTEIVSDVYTRKKLRVWLFQDTSGSCRHLAPRFFKAAASLDPAKFEVRMFCFDTRVYPTTLKSGKIYGGGGTAFSILETFVQKEIEKEKIEYPYLFVLTDGFGDVIKPQYPERWTWFLTSWYKDCIPTQSKTFNLSDFE